MASQTGSSSTPNSEKLTVAAGCFWGVEHLYRRHYGDGKGLLNATVGFCGGHGEHPSYKQVCTGTTGHAESLRVEYDPSVVNYRQLIEFFFRIHDPTTPDRQGHDIGHQYRSVIFTHNDQQRDIAKKITEKAEKEWWKKPLTTVITPVGQWWDAEEYHQLYFDHHPETAPCPTHIVRDFPPMSE